MFPDATFTGGEQTLGVIIETLLRQIGRLDAAEVTALADALVAYARKDDVKKVAT